MLIKIASAIILFLQVFTFAQIPYLYYQFNKNLTLTTFISCFSSGLFLGLSFLHILPDANLTLKKAFHYNLENSNNDANHTFEQHVELGSLIAIFTFIIILGIQTHFHNSSKFGGTHNHGDEQQQQQTIKSHQINDSFQQNDESLFIQKNMLFNEDNIQVILTQMALSIHSFFQCMSIGVQKSYSQVLTLAIGIIIHKWAQALTLGFTYRNANMSRNLAIKFTIVHSFLNGGAVLMGWFVSSGNDLVMGILSSISAGTFLYVCMIQKIKNEFMNSKRLNLKIGSMIIGVIFAYVIN